MEVTPRVVPQRDLNAAPVEKTDSNSTTKTPSEKGTFCAQISIN